MKNKERFDLFLLEKTEVVLRRIKKLSSGELVSLSGDGVYEKLLRLMLNEFLQKKHPDPFNSMEEIVAWLDKDPDYESMLKSMGWTTKQIQQHEEKNRVKTEDLTQPYWTDCERRPDGCLGCPCLKVTQDISGFEARCTEKTEKGKMISWNYGLDPDDCRNRLRESLKKHKYPAWCKRRKEDNHA